MAGEPTDGASATVSPTPKSSSLAQRAALARPAPRPASSPLPKFWTRKRRIWGSIFVASVLLVSFIAGIAWYWSSRSGNDQSYVEIYVTDLPANFSRLDLRVAGAYVGAGNYSLHVDQPAFDLLALHGPEDALLIASGYVPRANHTEVRIVFQSARAQLNGLVIPLAMPQSMLAVHHDFGLGRHHASAFLFDFDVEQSVEATAKGLVFHPVVKGVYIHDYDNDAAGNNGGLGGFTHTGAKPFVGETAKPPSNQKLETPTGKLNTNPKFQTSTPSPTTTTTSNFKWNGPTTTPPSTDGPEPTETSDSAPLPTDTVENGLPDPGGSNSIPSNPEDIGGWFVQFSENQTWNATSMSERVYSTGGQLVFTFGSLPAAYIFARASEAQALAKLPDVVYVESDMPVETELASAKVASRVAAVGDLLTGLKDAQGRAIDGRGVGVGIIDVGFDATHPDLQHKDLNPLNPAFLVNYKVESLFLVDEPMTDVGSGHGTHVAGIVGGRGILDPTQKGVAPAASLYGFAIGELSTTLWPNTALDWLVQNANQVDPPIRLVTNSWGSGNAYDPNGLTTQLVNKLVDMGVVVVFAAGNSGGDGSMATTTSQCQIPKEGVICVAAYNDLNSGTRDGKLADYSSRGLVTDPSTWPDISAPGDSIRSTQALLSGSVPDLLNSYEVMSGTSMAAPHVAGVIALMLQARPSLTPAQVESILESTAYHYTDHGTYSASADPRYNLDNVGKGHGLVDAYAAVQLAKIT